jgi:hypothetical protein
MGAQYNHLLGRGRPAQRAASSGGGMFGSCPFPLFESRFLFEMGVAPGGCAGSRGPPSCSRTAREWGDLGGTETPIREAAQMLSFRRSLRGSKFLLMPAFKINLCLTVSGRPEQAAINGKRDRSFQPCKTPKASQLPAASSTSGEHDAELRPRPEGHHDPCGSASRRHRSSAAIRD